VRRFSLFVLLLLALAACDGDGHEAAREARRETAPATAAPVPEARTEVGAGRLGDTIVVLGGFRADGSATDRVDVFDLGTRVWRDGPKLPAALHHVAAAAFGDRLFAAGGFTNAGTESSAVWSLGPGTGDTWREEPPLGTPRGALGLAATGDRLVAFGGTAGGRVLETAEVLAAGADGWRQAPSMRQPREHTAAASAGGRVYAIAGRVASLESNLVSVESIDPSAFAPEWRSEPDLRFSRGGTAAAATGDTVCVAGGEEPTGTIPSVECLVDGAWRTVATLSEPRHGLGVVAGDDGTLHVLAGGPQPGLFVSTAHEVLTLDL
jgi:hypothetical protein